MCSWPWSAQPAATHSWCLPACPLARAGLCGGEDTGSGSPGFGRYEALCLWPGSVRRDVPHSWCLPACPLARPGLCGGEDKGLDFLLRRPHQNFVFMALVDTAGSYTVMRLLACLVCVEVRIFNLGPVTSLVQKRLRSGYRVATWRRLRGCWRHGTTRQTRSTPLAYNYRGHQQLSGEHIKHVTDDHREEGERETERACRARALPCVPQVGAGDQGPDRDRGAGVAAAGWQVGGVRSVLLSPCAPVRRRLLEEEREGEGARGGSFCTRG